MKIQSAAQSHRNILGLAAIALAICALAACSNGSTASPPAPTSAASGAGSGQATAGDPAKTDTGGHADAVANGISTARKPCDLLTRADSEAAVGQLLPKNNVNIELGTCDYTADDFSAGTHITVGSWESLKSEATTGPHKPAAIGGVGDEASNIVNSGDSILLVRRGDEGFALELHGRKIDPLSDHGLAAERELALKILGKF